MKKNKITLDKLNVESFQTTINNTGILKGGCAGPYGPCITIAATCPTVALTLNCQFDS